LDKNINLLDCPGIVFSQSTNQADSAQVLLRNCVKVELLQDPIAPVDVILSRCSIENLQELYGLPPFHDTNTFLIEYAKMRGKLLKVIGLINV
jgi:nuclear GTP-binding protein